MLVISCLIWDSGNGSHVARHQINPEEVVQVCDGDHILRQAYDGRLMLIGPTATGRWVSVVLEPAGDEAYYPVTARPAGRAKSGVFTARRKAETPMADTEPVMKPKE